MSIRGLNIHQTQGLLKGWLTAKKMGAHEEQFPDDSRGIEKLSSECEIMLTGPNIFIILLPRIISAVVRQKIKSLIRKRG